jgi:hypothetical protein
MNLGPNIGSPKQKKPSKAAKALIEKYENMPGRECIRLYKRDLPKLIEKQREKKRKSTEMYRIPW